MRVHLDNHSWGREENKVLTVRYIVVGIFYSLISLYFRHRPPLKKIEYRPCSVNLISRFFMCANISGRRLKVNVNSCRLKRVNDSHVCKCNDRKLISRSCVGCFILPLISKWFSDSHFLKGWLDLLCHLDLLCLFFPPRSLASGFTMLPLEREGSRSCCFCTASLSSGRSKGRF